MPPLDLATERLDHGGGRPVVWLHGFLGDRDNLRGTAGRVAGNLGRDAVLVDLRNHGDSPHARPVDSASMGDDMVPILEALAAEAGGPVDLAGHSLGGRVAMHAALAAGAAVRRLLVIDIAPRDYGPVNRNLLDALESVDLASLQSRGDADAQLATVIETPAVRRFLLKSLIRADTGWHWRFNLADLSRNYSELHAPLADASWEGPVLLVRGGRSDYVRDADIEAARRWFPRLRAATIPEADHWIHVTTPDAFCALVTDFLRVDETG